jgi:hypothetical protein
MRLRALALAAAALATAFAHVPANATTAPKQVMRPHRLVADASPLISYGSGNLVSHGGPVENGSRNYLIFWGFPPTEAHSTCTSPCPAGDLMPYAYEISKFFMDVSSTHLYSLLGQYGVNGPSTYNGAWADVPAAKTTLTDADVQAEVAKARAATGWPGGVGNNYIVFTPPGVKECSSFGCSATDFCGYHDYTTGNTPYAIIPYPENSSASCTAVGAPNVVPGADDAINITSHELFEILTDPLLSAWWDGAGYEVGDKCAWIFGPRNPAVVGGDVTVGTDSYLVQEEYSNSLGDCTM